MKECHILRPIKLAIFVVLVIVGSAIVTPAQSTSAAALEEMRKLDFLIGEWKGKGSMLTLTGKPSGEVTQTTKVKKRAGDSTLEITDKKKVSRPSAKLRASFADALELPDGKVWPYFNLLRRNR